ncbi:MAG TPA: CysB family HTH-type transcriptional regulator [Hyphomicrobium sp.]|jgi:LysR family cys regulon transcriptional activator
MNFQQLRIIRETARCNFNLTEVANALLTSQSGVSKHVKDFEDELGIELFVRRGKRLLGLTDAGKEAIEIVERMLIDAQNLSQIGGRLSSADEGTLRIVTTHTQARYTLPPIIACFKQAFPHVRLALNQASPRDIAAILLEGETDIGLATDTMENTAGLVTFPYYTWEHAIIVPAGHPLERTASLTLEDVAEWPIITYDEGLTGRTRIDDAFARDGLIPDIAISALDADVIKSYVELGLGVGIIAAMAFDPERDTKLRRLGCSSLFDTNTSSLGVRRGRYLRGYVYRFIELCSPALTEAVVRKAL